jgi:hypothetical protein
MDLRRLLQIVQYTALLLMHGQHLKIKHFLATKTALFSLSLSDPVTFVTEGVS